MDTVRTVPPRPADALPLAGRPSARFPEVTVSVRRTLKQALAALTSPGWFRVHTDPEQLHQVLAEQTAAANRAAADHATGAAQLNVDELHVQPGLLEVRRSVLADVHYLEGLLIGARSRGLDAELIERLAAAVDTGHELTVLLADAARTTITARTAGH